MQSEVERLQEERNPESHLVVGFRAMLHSGQNGVGMTASEHLASDTSSPPAHGGTGRPAAPHGPRLKQATHPGVNHRQAFFKAAEERTQAKRPRQLGVQGI
jgi:hypothetical protein